MQPMDDLPLVSFHVMTIMQTLGYVVWNLYARFWPWIQALDGLDQMQKDGARGLTWSSRSPCHLLSPTLAGFYTLSFLPWPEGKKVPPFAERCSVPHRKGPFTSYQSVWKDSTKSSLRRGKTWGGVGRHERERERTRIHFWAFSHPRLAVSSH